MDKLGKCIQVLECFVHVDIVSGCGGEGQRIASTYLLLNWNMVIVL